MSTTVCQVYLLMGRKGKFHQFAGLVDKCESGDPRTTCQDLQGFWDMIFIQVTFTCLCFLYLHHYTYLWGSSGMDRETNVFSHPVNDDSYFRASVSGT